MKISKKNLKN